MNKKERTRIPPHSLIYDYWKTKIITKDYEVEDFVENSEVKGDVVVKDWGEPECWCCGKFVSDVGIHKHKTYHEDLKTERGICRIWNYKEVVSELNRCHITPKALGGDYEVSNIFLLCNDCHEKSPDTMNSKIFFAWILANKRSPIDGQNFDSEAKKEEYHKEIINGCKSFNIEVSDFAKYINKNIKEMEDFLNNNTNTHGFKYSVSTIVGGMISMYLLSTKKHINT